MTIMQEAVLNTSDIHIIQLTHAALQQVKNILRNEPVMIGIRLSVVGGGCAGLQYKMEPVSTAKPDDLCQTVEDVSFYIHPMAAPYLKGVLLDFDTSLMDGGFKFNNPNATSTCGCGTSFGI